MEERIFYPEKNEPKKVAQEQKPEPSAMEKLESLWQESENVVKKSPMKLPKKAKVKKGKAKKGFIGVVYIDENRNARGEKVQLRDGAFKTRDELIHATEGKEIIWWDGKFPVVIQEAKKINPKRMVFNEGENQTYGQRYIRAKLLQEIIKPKGANMSWLIWVIVIGGAGFLIYKFLAGGGST